MNDRKTNEIHRILSIIYENNEAQHSAVKYLDKKFQLPTDAFYAIRLRAEIYLSKCSKAFTQARRPSCHWRTAASKTRWSTASQTVIKWQFISHNLATIFLRWFVNLPAYACAKFNWDWSAFGHDASDCLFLNMMNFVGFSVFRVSQDSVATC